jgi:hypothetical protein
MPASEIDRGIDRLGTPSAVRELRDPENQPARPLKILQTRGSAKMIASVLWI